MYRSRRVLTVRHALSATLLGWAALAHATTPKAVDDPQWTRVDLDDAPSLVIGAPATVKGGKDSVGGAPKPVAAPTRKSDTTKAAKKTSESKTGSKKSNERDTAAVKNTLASTSSEDKVNGEMTVEPAQVSLLEPAQPTKALEAATKVPESKPKETPAEASDVSVKSGQTAASGSVRPRAITVEPARVEPAQVAPEPKKADAVPAAVKAPLVFTLTPKDRTIRAGLERWAASAGWKLSWELDDKFQSGGVVRFDADFGGDFDIALSKLAGAIRSEVKTHAYLYGGNKVLRILEEPAKPAVQPAVPMTPVIPDGAQRDTGDRGLPYVTRVKGYWLGASGTESEAAPAQSLPPMFNASVSLLFSEKANLGTVIGILSKVTGIVIVLPGAIEYPASSLFINDTPAPGKKKKSAETKAKHTYVGTPRALLDRISVSTGMLWEYKDETIVFSE